MVLHQDDLKDFGVTTLTNLEQAGSSIYRTLNELRRNKLNQASEGLKKAVDKAEAAHQNTVKLLGLLRKPSIFSSRESNPEVQEIQECLKSFN